MDVGDDPSIEGLRIRKSWALGVDPCLTVCDVTVAEHFDVLLFLRFIFNLVSFLVSGDFCTVFSSGVFGFMSFADGAIVINGKGDFRVLASVFSGCLLLSGEPDRSDVGDADLLLQFLSQSSGVMRLEVEEAFTRCGLRSRCACVSRQNICILY